MTLESEMQLLGFGHPAFAVGSHVSGGSTKPLPQEGLQLLSLSALQPDGQQLSSSAQPVMVPASAPASAPLTHSRWHPVPLRTNSEQPWFGHVVGQDAPPPASPTGSSHFSPVSRTPLPQKGLQSGSLVELHGPAPPPGQHPSPVALQALMVPAT